MKEEYVVTNDKGQHDYTIVVKEKRDIVSYTLKYSNGPQWNTHVQGQKIMKLTDTGNGVNVKCFGITDQNHTLEYDQEAELRLLLNFKNEIQSGIKYPLHISQREHILTT